MYRVLSSTVVEKELFPSLISLRAAICSSSRLLKSLLITVLGALNCTFDFSALIHSLLVSSLSASRDRGSLIYRIPKNRARKTQEEWFWSLLSQTSLQLQRPLLKRLRSSLHIPILILRSWLQLPSEVRVGQRLVVRPRHALLFKVSTRKHRIFSLRVLYRQLLNRYPRLGASVS